MTGANAIFPVFLSGLHPVPRYAIIVSVIDMEAPRRKANRIADFDYNRDGAYFVTICTEGRRKILSEIVGDDAHIVPTPCGQVVEKYIRSTPEIEKYVIMPDHIHIIIRLHNGSMWASTPTVQPPQHHRVASIVRSLKVLTTKEIGKSIFQRSYYDHVIRNRQDYDEIWEYIENNPRKWVILKEGRV